MTAKAKEVSYVTQASFDELVAKVDELQKTISSKRDRGPKSETKMTDEIAHAIKFGSDVNLTNKECCSKYGLSYGQVYSCRNEYTFNHVKATDFETDS